MSKISGKYRASFGLHIVSGMLRGGNLIISYASGIPAWGQLDYGYDNSVPYRSPKVLVKPGEPGYREGKETPKLMRFHEYAFPTTYVDTEHFFRARVTNPAGRTLISSIYSVYVPEKMVIQSRVGAVRADVHPVSPASYDSSAAIPSTIIDNLSIDPDVSDIIAVEGGATLQPVSQKGASSDQTTTIGTNPTLTVD